MRNVWHKAPAGSDGYGYQTSSSRGSVVIIVFNLNKLYFFCERRLEEFKHLKSKQKVEMVNIQHETNHFIPLQKSNKYDSKNITDL